MRRKLEDKVGNELGAVKRFAKEFEAFVTRGNVVDLAVGVVIGGAFGKIVSSLVNDVIIPLIGGIFGGVNFAGVSVQVGSATITYGNFIQNIIDFIFIAAGIFIFIKVVNAINRNANGGKTPKKEDQQITLLKEIRDELKKR